MADAGWLCRHGYHKWRFLKMDDVREVSVPPHWSYVCTLIERCERCRLRRTSTHSPLPKRPKMPAHYDSSSPD